MRITKFEQKPKSVHMKTSKPRLSKDKKAYLLAHLKEIRDILKINGDFSTVQVVFTGEEKEISAIIQDKE